MILSSVCIFRSLQDVQIWFQPNTSSSSDAFLPHSDSQDGFGKSVSKRNQIFLLISLTIYNLEMKCFFSIKMFFQLVLN